MNKKKVCPQCGNRNVVPIIYGLPTYEDYLESKEGNYRLGGCIVPAPWEGPFHTCNSCNWEGIGENIFNDEHLPGLIELKAEVNKIDGPSYQILFQLVEGKGVWQKRISGALVREVVKNLSIEEIEGMIEGLKECRVLSWKEEYKNEEKKGEPHWEIRLTFLFNETVKKSGKGAYPREWNEFCGLLEDTMRKPFY